MKLAPFAVALALASYPAVTHAKLPPLRDPVFLNIGFVCQWQERCVERQQRAMKRSLGYVKKYRPATWKIEQCNRNASRRRGRVDWIGFEHCIRNPKIVHRSVASRGRR